MPVGAPRNVFVRRDGEVDRGAAAAIAVEVARRRQLPLEIVQGPDNAMPVVPGPLRVPRVLVLRIMVESKDSKVINAQPRSGSFCAGSRCRTQRAPD